MHIRDSQDVIRFWRIFGVVQFLTLAGGACCRTVPVRKCISFHPSDPSDQYAPVIFLPSSISTTAQVSLPHRLVIAHHLRCDTQWQGRHLFLDVSVYILFLLVFQTNCVITFLPWKPLGKSRNPEMKPYFYVCLFVCLFVCFFAKTITDLGRL